MCRNRYTGGKTIAEEATIHEGREGGGGAMNRPYRKAAIEGQNLRHLIERFLGVQFSCGRGCGKWNTIIIMLIVCLLFIFRARFCWFFYLLIRVTCIICGANVLF